jgi:hypothetical protein
MSHIISITKSIKQTLKDTHMVISKTTAIHGERAL